MSRKSGFYSDAGFTLIEVLVALAIITTMLASIGGVIAATVKGTRSIDQRLGLYGAAETLLVALPARDGLVAGVQTGGVFQYGWRVAVTPMVAAADIKNVARWTPLSIDIRVQAAGGPSLTMTTVRLVRIRPQ